MFDEQLENQLWALELLRSRPALMIGDHDPKKAMIFLAGFQCGVGLGVASEENRQIHEDVITRRGWQVKATGEIQQMIDRGMSADQIIDECVSIELEAFKNGIDRWHPESSRSFNDLHRKVIERVKQGGAKDI